MRGTRIQKNEGMITSPKTHAGIQSLLNLLKEEEVTKPEPLVYSQKLRMIESIVFQKAIKAQMETNKEESIHTPTRKQWTKLQYCVLTFQ